MENTVTKLKGIKESALIKISKLVHLKVKIFFILFITLLACSIPLYVVVERNVQTTHIEFIKKELFSISSITAFNVNGDIIEDIIKEEDYESDQYSRLKDQLQKTMLNNDRIKDIYIMRKSAETDKIFLFWTQTLKTLLNLEKNIAHL